MWLFYPLQHNGECFAVTLVVPSPLLHICALLPQCSDILFQWCSGSVQTYLSIFSCHYTQKHKSEYLGEESLFLIFFFYSGKAHCKLSGWKHNLCRMFLVTGHNYWIHVYHSRGSIANDVVSASLKSLYLMSSCLLN